MLLLGLLPNVDVLEDHAPQAARMTPDTGDPRWISRPIAFLASAVTAGRKLTRVLVDLVGFSAGQGTAQVGRCARCGPTSCGERECERVNLAGAG